MSPSESNAAGVAGQRLAITAEVLYLANLLLLPGVAFLALFYLYRSRLADAPPLAVHHLRQTFSASLWAGGLLVLVSLLILLLGGYQGVYTWMVLITYFTLFHSSLVLLGILGLARAMAGQRFRYPLVGRR